MFQPRKSVLHFAAGGLALGALILAAPRAAHGIAATLVQITNTAANPAIAQSPITQAGQIVELVVAGGAGITQSSGFVPANQFSVPSGLASQPHAVPTGQNLVITGIDMNVIGTLYFSLYIPVNSGYYGISTASLTSGFQQIKYPSGIVVPAGTSVYVGLNSGGTVGNVLIHGYLTSN